MNNWRWVKNGAFDGATNMALDHVLLINAFKTNQPAVRLYSWKPYCISIGYHQTPDIFNKLQCVQKGIDIVQRPTGGRAVFHAEELTYSVLIPSRHSFMKRSIAEVYHLINSALIKGLKLLDLPVALEKRSLDLKEHYKKEESVSCFSASAHHEILLNHKKLVGSAQRRFSEGLLQHGSILLGDAHQQIPDFFEVSDNQKLRLKEQLKDKTAVVQDFIQGNIKTDVMSGALKKGFEKTFSIRFEDIPLQPDELKQAANERDQWKIMSASDANLTGLCQEG